MKRRAKEFIPDDEKYVEIKQLDNEVDIPEASGKKILFTWLKTPDCTAHYFTVLVNISGRGDKPFDKMIIDTNAYSNLLSESKVEKGKINEEANPYMIAQHELLSVTLVRISHNQNFQGAFLYYRFEI